MFVLKMNLKNLKKKESIASVLTLQDKRCRKALKKYIGKKSGRFI